jgi:hypothetical protein
MILVIIHAAAALLHLDSQGPHAAADAARLDAVKSTNWKSRHNVAASRTPLRHIAFGGL